MSDSDHKLQQLLKCNPFELFNINTQFDVDYNLINETYLNLQKQYHPDGRSGNKYALLLSAHINNSFAILKNPLERSIKLLEIMGEPLDLSIDTALPAEFLIDQIELHEQIEEAISDNSIEKLELLEIKITQLEQNVIQKISNAFIKKDLTEVKNNTKQLAFYNKVKTNLNVHITNLI